MKKSKFIWVTFQKEGIHKYPDAPEGVEFLKYPHRHMFHFRVELEGLYNEGTLQLDYKSCEMMADDLYDYISTAYPERDIVIEVSEDLENGTRAYYPK